MATKKTILDQFKKWNAAIQTGAPKTVVKLNAPKAILLPTMSDKVRHNHGEIEGYFHHFLANGPCGMIDEANVRIFGNLAINSGVYTFTFKSGPLSKVQARFTYVYRLTGKTWRIVEHHSSAMPEQCADWCLAKHTLAKKSASKKLKG